MPYADPAMNNACKRAWEREQKRLNTAYWQLKQKRISRRKWRKRRRELKPIYLRELSKKSGVPVETTRRKILLRRAGPALVFLVAAGKIRSTRMSIFGPSSEASKMDKA